MEEIKQTIEHLSDAMTSYTEDINTFIEEKETQLAFEKNKDLTGEWTKEYTAGYTDAYETLLAEFKELITN